MRDKRDTPRQFKMRFYAVFLALGMFCFNAEIFAVETQWVKTVTSEADSSEFMGASLDPAGNIYAVGNIRGVSSHDFGNNVTAMGVSSSNCVIVKYNATGVAQWAKTALKGSLWTRYAAVAIEPSGKNVYAVGYIAGKEACFGEGITVEGGNDGNAVLVKYSSAGDVLWANTVLSAPAIGESLFASATSEFNAVTVDAAGNIYAVGYVKGSGIYSFGGAATFDAKTTFVGQAVIVKYDPKGNALWVRTIQSQDNDSDYYGSKFYSVAVDSAGNVYAAGNIQDEGLLVFGDDVYAKGAYPGAANSVLVKYNAAGEAQWARTTLKASSTSYFNSIAIDPAGKNIYAAGHLSGAGDFGFGKELMVKGTSASENAVLVKYSASGSALWAKSVVSGSKHSQFDSVALDAAGNIYAAGYCKGTEAFGFGGSMTVNGVSTDNNLLIVKYNAAGVPQWVGTDKSRIYSSYCSAVIVDRTGKNIYLAGSDQLSEKNTDYCGMLIKFR
ncbi:MAG TPA: hypothetical protein VHY08_07685 [Bacillota bacterium]|nr:hypothetical protein [Bacillota bacterium]